MAFAPPRPGPPRHKPGRLFQPSTTTVEQARTAEAAGATVTIKISVPARRRTEVPIKLGFPVASIDDARDRAGGLGGLVDPPDTDWVLEGFRRCDGVDP